VVQSCVRALSLISGQWSVWFRRSLGTCPITGDTIKVIVLTLKGRTSGCDFAKNFVAKQHYIQYPVTSPVTTTQDHRRGLGIDNKIKNKYPYYLRREHGNRSLTGNKIKTNTVKKKKRY